MCLTHGGQTRCRRMQDQSDFSNKTTTVEVFGDVIPRGSAPSVEPAATEAPVESRRLSAQRRLAKRKSGRRLSENAPTTCWDRPNWKDGRSGQTCEDYRQNYCDGQRYKPSLNANRSSGDVNSPDLYCCGCGRCSDEDHWTDPCLQHTRASDVGHTFCCC